MASWRPIKDVTRGWKRMLEYQRDRARDDLGKYDHVADIPIVNVDQALALIMYWERSYSIDDQWPRGTADDLMCRAAGVDPDAKRPTRSLDDVAGDAAEAFVFWSFLGARADQLEPLCYRKDWVDPRNQRHRGFCPKDFEYKDGSSLIGQSAQRARLVRLGLAIQRKYKLVKPPPLIDPIGSVLKLLAWFLIGWAVFAESRDN